MLNTMMNVSNSFKKMIYKSKKKLLFSNKTKKIWNKLEIKKKEIELSQYHPYE